MSSDNISCSTTSAQPIEQYTCHWPYSLLGLVWKGGSVETLEPPLNPPLLIKLLYFCQLEKQRQNLAKWEILVIIDPLNTSYSAWSLVNDCTNLSTTVKEKFDKTLYSSVPYPDETLRQFCLQNQIHTSVSGENSAAA